MTPGNHNARKGKQNRAVNLNMRCERDELDGWKQAAQDRGLTLADYVRAQMNGKKRRAAK
jgi:hypothetical protein